MAVDQGTFDAALSAFLSDLNNGLAAIQAKLDSAGAAVDLSAEMQQISDAKATFDAQVAADTSAPAPAPSEPAPAPTDTAQNNQPPTSTDQPQ